MNGPIRPWRPIDRLPGEPVAFGPDDCSTLAAFGDDPIPDTFSLARWTVGGGERSVRQFRYALPSRPVEGVRFEGLPQRPPAGHTPTSEREERNERAQAFLDGIVGRVRDLEDALLDPAKVWDRLDRAWKLAAREDVPLMSEIVRQAGTMGQVLARIEPRLRRVLRRKRELTPLGRVEQLDRAGMVWLSRQPGRNLHERAGASQRVLAVVRRENFNTIENRVVRSYCDVAALIGRDWCRRNARARHAPRYKRVDAFARTCRRLAETLASMGVGHADPAAVPNYVLTNDADYRQVRTSWLRLLKQETEKDELWVWQARLWTDFVTLAITLALRDVPGSRLVASSPLHWPDDHERGALLNADNPLAVFFLERQQLVVEVQLRMPSVEPAQGAFGTPLWLRIGDLVQGGAVRRVPVWSLHNFQQLDLEQEATDVAQAMPQIMARAARRGFTLARGLVVVPAVDEPGSVDRGIVRAVSLGPDGESLRQGRIAIGEFVRSLVRGVAA